ncbi:cell wall hydrolase [Acuticoccus sp. MNP-M23]|uniref:cell wall hydrolase n=1 Tax=Acuticoccus sp. MNP-M23 TaxID=3072793 RepID=UPI002814D06D|nr:cell wall hydrolase [Acuticoccus sp. MNP-M23]WMS43616.1 cell wall hydrolase [Acuticoccus sp. MNP-M23]
MRVFDLPHGLARRGFLTSSLYVPPVRHHRRGRIRRIAATLVLVAPILGILSTNLGDLSGLAALTMDRPAWALSLRAPESGMTLSPQLGGAGDVALAVPHDDTPAAKAGSLAPPHGGVERAMFSPLSGFLTEATPAALPRVSFVAAPRAAGTHRDPRAPSDTARAALTSMLSAYAPDRVDIDTPFKLLLGEAPQPVATPGVSGGGLDHWWSDRPLPQDIAGKKSLRCLTEAIYFEARGESETGQRAVAQVVINRVKNPAYPDDVCGVVYQNKGWRNRCQFTFACDRVRDVVRNKDAWTLAATIATEYASGAAWMNEIGAATHYHAKRVNPRWAGLMRKVETIDDHIFYLTRGGGWT